MIALQEHFEVVRDFQSCLVAHLLSDCTNVTNLTIQESSLELIEIHHSPIGEATFPQAIVLVMQILRNLLVEILKVFDLGL